MLTMILNNNKEDVKNILVGASMNNDTKDIQNDNDTPREKGRKEGRRDEED